MHEAKGVILAQSALFLDFSDLPEAVHFHSLYI